MAPRRHGDPLGTVALRDLPHPSKLGKGTVVATDGLGVLKVREGTPISREDYGNKVIELAKRLGPVKHVRGRARLGRAPNSGLPWSVRRARARSRARSRAAGRVPPRRPAARCRLRSVGSVP